MKRWLKNSQLAPGKRVAGYTITEVMIVLAVTTALFFVVAITFQGRQARNEFIQAVRDYEARLQTLSSEVYNGSYQDIICSAPPVGGPPVFNGTNVPGSCIFMGKRVVHQGRVSQITPIVGRRTTGNPPQDVTSLDESEWRFFTSSENFNHSFQLEVRRVVSLADNTTVDGIALLYPLASSSSIYTDQSAGSRLADLYAFVEPDNLEPMPEGLLICLLGQNGQRAEIRIGGQNSQSALTSVLDTENQGACRDA